MVVRQMMWQNACKMFSAQSGIQYVLNKCHLLLISPIVWDVARMVVIKTSALLISWDVI